MNEDRTWRLTNHLCRGCGGRILRCVSGGGVTGGGNPIWKCADCGKEAAAMKPDAMCWCGMSHKHNHNSTAYVCVSFSILKTRPELLQAFLACGCDPLRGGEVGIMLERAYRARETPQ